MKSIKFLLGEDYRSGGGAMDCFQRGGESAGNPSPGTGVGGTKPAKSLCRRPLWKQVMTIN
jgi:hypothetical protein